MMATKRNLVCHWQGDPEDRVYITSVWREGSEWVVRGTWGRRNRPGWRSQDKLRVGNEASAVAEQVRLHKERLEARNKHYVDIEDPNYSGPLKMSTPCVAEHLAPEDSGAPPPPKPKKPEPPKVDPDPVDIGQSVLTCIDNTGLENYFDEGVEYIVEEHPNEEMIFVYDRFGEKQECFKERFVLGPATLPG
jgi:hypothetical protein